MCSQRRRPAFLRTGFRLAAARFGALRAGDPCRSVLRFAGGFFAFFRATGLLTTAFFRVGFLVGFLAGFLAGIPAAAFVAAVFFAADFLAPGVTGAAGASAPRS